MDSKDFELYAEEQKKALEAVSGALRVLAEQVEILNKSYVAPHKEVEVKGAVTVNTEKTVTVDNLDAINFKDEADSIVKAIVENKPLGEVTVSNMSDAKPDSVKINNLRDLEDLFAPYIDAVKAIQPLVKVNPSLKLDYDAKNPLAVRLSDGKSFYKAMFSAVNAAIETDPFVGYQPADEDKSGLVNYYGFTRKSGAWYIMANDKANGTYRYATGSPQTRGGGLYTDAWTNRASLTYGYFHEVFNV